LKWLAQCKKTHLNALHRFKRLFTCFQHTPCTVYTKHSSWCIQKALHERDMCVKIYTKRISWERGRMILLKRGEKNASQDKSITNNPYKANHDGKKSSVIHSVCLYQLMYQPTSFCSLLFAVSNANISEFPISWVHFICPSKHPHFVLLFSAPKRKS